MIVYNSSQSVRIVSWHKTKVICSEHTMRVISVLLPFQRASRRTTSASIPSPSLNHQRLLPYNFQERNCHGVYASDWNPGALDFTLSSFSSKSLDSDDPCFWRELRRSRMVMMVGRRHARHVSRRRQHPEQRPRRHDDGRSSQRHHQYRRILSRPSLKTILYSKTQPT